MSELAAPYNIGNYEVVYVNEDCLKEINACNNAKNTFPKQSKLYQIGDSIYEENESLNVQDNREEYARFELYEERVNSKMESGGLSNTHLSEEDKHSDTPLNIEAQKVPQGLIINSNVFLTDHQWNTMVFIDIHLTKCVVCEILCDLDSCPEHIERPAHKENLDKYKPLEKFDLSITRKINKNYHCGVCNEVFDVSSEGDHEMSKTHEGNLLFAINKVTDIMCDVNIHTENNNYSYNFDANAIYNSSSVASSNYFDDDAASNFDATDVPTNFEGPSYASMARKPKLNMPKCMKIDLGHREVRVKFDYWHMITKTELNKFYCMVCQVHDHIRYKSVHCMSCDHVEKLGMCSVVGGFGDYLVRTVSNDKLLHCGQCNNLQMKHEMSIHIELVHPRKNKNITDATKACNSPPPSRIKKERTYSGGRVENSVPKTQSPAPKITDSAVNKTAFDIGTKEIDIFGDMVLNLFGYKQTIKYLSYNVVYERDGEYYCHLCDVTCTENLFAHIHSLVHIQVLQMTPFIRPFSCNLIRAVRGSLHCALCNELVPAATIHQHNLQAFHTTVVANTLGLIPNTKTVKDAPNQSQTFTQTDQIENVSENNTNIPQPCALNKTLNISASGSKSNLNNRKEDPVVTKKYVSVPQTKSMGAQYNITVPQIKPIGNPINIPVPQLKGIHNNTPRPQLSPIRTFGTQNNIPRPYTSGPQNDFKKHESALIGAPLYVHRPLLIPANPIRPQTPPPFGSDFQNKPHSNQQHPSDGQNITACQFSPTQFPNYFNRPTISPFSSQRNTPSPQNSVPIASGTQSPAKTENSLQMDAELKNAETLSLASGTNESFCEDEHEGAFDTEAYVYVKMKNTYLKITFSSYNSLVHLGDTWRHCFVCSINVDFHELRRHVDSRGHTENVKKYNFLEKYEKNLLRQIYLMYHCSICNVLVSRRDVKAHVMWPTHVTQMDIKLKISKRSRNNEIKSGARVYTVATQKERIFLNEKEPESKVHINAFIVQKNTEIKKCKIIILNDNVLKVGFDNWNGIAQTNTGGKCIVCQEELAEDCIVQHLNTGSHKESVQKEFDLRYKPALIRKINDSTAHCVICNTEVPNKDINILAHINGKKHVKNFDAVLKDSSSCDTYTDCDENFLTLTN